MKPADFQELAARFAVRPITPRGAQRHVYLWHCDYHALERCLPRGTAKRIDLHQLAKTLTKKPMEREPARSVLAEAVEQTLREVDSGDFRQQIVLVMGCDLLMRYAVSLGPIFQAASDTRMIVLVAPPYSPPTPPLPQYVDFHADATFEYLRSGMSDAVIVQ